MGAIVGLQIDLHCDDGCDIDALATVADDGDVVTLERDCCGREVEMAHAEFNEYLRD